MSEEIAVKDCPFCGKPPRICPDTSYGYGLVFCPDDNDCPVQPDAEAVWSEGEKIEDAIRKWNTRAQQEQSS